MQEEVDWMEKNVRCDRRIRRMKDRVSADSSQTCCEWRRCTTNVGDEAEKKMDVVMEEMVEVTVKGTG